MDKAEYKEFVDIVLAASDIVDVVSAYIPLKESGRKFWGCCPFHNEKTPSFTVDREKKLFYCFGCHAGGRLFDFIMKVENITFWEAVKLLAGKYNIPIPQKEKTPEEIARDQQRSLMYRAHEMAGKFFHSCLVNTQYGVEARDYLNRRGLDASTVAKFQIGFAPNAWSKLTDALLKRGFSEQSLETAGLSLPRQKGGAYDRFRNRVMFPIFNERNKLVGFGGRVLDDSNPKYLNSPESIIFNKRRLLFALNLAAASIREQGYAIVVEGYMDVITAHQHGVTNVVASLGTAFSQDHCKLLLRYTDNVVFAYDSDSAGQQATFRALELIKNSGVNIKVMSLPDGKDPDEFLNKHSAEEFKILASRALSFVDYHIQRTLQENEYADLNGKVAVINKLLPVLAGINNAVETNEYIKQVSQVLNIDEGSVRSEVSRFIFQNQKDKNVKKGQNTTISVLAQRVDNAADRAERQLIRLMWEDSAIVPYVEAQLTPEQFASIANRQIVELLSAAAAQQINIDEMYAASRLPNEAKAELSRCLMQELDCPDRLQLVDACIRAARRRYLETQYEKHRLSADRLERAGDEAFLAELEESQRIKREIDALREG